MHRVTVQGDRPHGIHRVRQRDGTVKIVTRTGSKTHDLFLITRLNQVFELFSDEEQAIASFNEA